MLSPHQSSILSLVSGGQGAAACTMLRSEDTSYLVLISSGSCKSLWNIVGTMWLWVTLYLSMRSSAPSGVHLSISTTEWPM